MASLIFGIWATAQPKKYEYSELIAAHSPSDLFEIIATKIPEGNFVSINIIMKTDIPSNLTDDYIFAQIDIRTTYDNPAVDMQAKRGNFGTFLAIFLPSLGVSIFSCFSLIYPYD